MNDLLQHIGRKIASNNSLDEPGKQSRLWLSIDIYDVLMNHKGTEAIQGIIPRKLHTKDALEGESFTMETFKRMSKLRFLYLKKVNFKGSFEQAFEELRWFCWDSCPLKCLPSHFCPQELVILELPHSNMRTFQEPNMVSNVFGKLKTLNMSYSQDLITTPDFIKLPCLENLNLGYCKSLEEIHVSIGSLVWLVSLNLHGCVKLRSIPDTICNLRSLEILDIDRCSGITALPSGFSQLSNLQYLNLNSCDNLFSIAKLPPNLKQIYASGCFSLERLPNLSNLKQLEELNLSYCSGLTEIQGLEELSSIRRLRLEGGRHISLLAYKHLTQHLFLLYSEFGHQISVYAPEFLPRQSSESSKSESTVNAHLLPNKSHNFRGIILCFKRRPKDYITTSFDCSVKNTTSGFIWKSDCLDVPVSELLFVLVPKSVFSITDDDNRIELTANNVIIVGIHLLYKTKTETTMIEDVVKKHETSIDALNLVDPVLKDIFLDIACFFIRAKRKEVVSILETYYPDVDGAIDTLKNRCLLKINNADELEMNYILQHTGKMIACNNSPDEPGKHSRLWLSIDIYDTLKKQRGTETIKSIIPRNVYPRKDALEGESFTSEAFKKMSTLRFLYLKNANISGSFQQAFEDLRWLRWDSCPLKCFPSAFHPQKLVTLMLLNSNMRTMWDPNMVSHVFEKLKTLNMSFSQDLTTTPDFNKLPCLVTLILKGCISLEEVHISIGSLVRLVSLDLHGCVKLRSLPHSICNLRALKVLDIHDCCSLEALPMALGSTKSPRELVAENLTVSKLPDSIEHLSKLVELRYISDKNLESLTDTICNLRSLEILDISRCEKLEILLNQVFTLTRLRELNAGGATLLKIHPNLGLSQMALSLQKLDFSDSALTALPSAISQLTKVEYLDLKDCHRLLSITELPPNLKRIRASGCKSMQRFPNLSDLKQLEILELTDCGGLSDIQGLKGLTSVRDLHLEGCNSTFLANIFTKCLFQIYSEFGHPIQISAPLAEFPYWIRQSSEYGSTMCLELLPNVSHHFLGMILCFKSLGSSTVYTIKNTTSDFKWSGSFCPCSRNPLMVIVPRSIFSVSNGDDKIELTTKDAEIYGIHLLYKTKGYDCE